jgi:hypothetical protein
MIERAVLRVLIAMSVPIASAVVMEQLPKTGVAEVPFAFEAAGQMLPPGRYSVKQAERGRILRIQNQRVPAIQVECVALERKFGRAKGARLVFSNDSEHYHLSEIWFDADGTGLVLKQSRTQRRAAAGELQFVPFE